jgi:hypothetical protein
MNVIKEEPDSESETYESQVHGQGRQEGAAEGNNATEPFAFAAVKVEVKVRKQSRTDGEFYWKSHSKIQIFYFSFVICILIQNFLQTF